MTATDGGQAVALAKQFGPDLMVLDVTLPGLSSQAVATQVRELRGRAFPVLVITADGQTVKRRGGSAHTRICPSRLT
jgi:two-component system OmpR family response regulator